MFKKIRKPKPKDFKSKDTKKKQSKRKRTIKDEYDDFLVESSKAM